MTDVLPTDCTTMLRTIRLYDRDDTFNFTPEYPTASWIAEIAISELARDARLTHERARAALEELIARDTPGITIEGDSVVLSGT